MSSSTSFTNATVLDCIGAEPLEGAHVQVADGRIQEIITAAAVPDGDFGAVIDTRGNTLLPGLIHAHVHLGAIDVNILDQHRQYPASPARMTPYVRALQRSMTLAEPTGVSRRLLCRA